MSNFVLARMRNLAFGVLDLRPRLASQDRLSNILTRRGHWQIKLRMHVLNMTVLIMCGCNQGKCVSTLLFTSSPLRLPSGPLHIRGCSEVGPTKRSRSSNPFCKYSRMILVEFDPPRHEELLSRDLGIQCRIQENSLFQAR